MTCKIDIAFPESYSTSENNYLILYVLDAWFCYGIVVQTYRALLGFSAGGIFSTYVVFNHPGMFQRYIIGGPAAWYDNYLVPDYEKNYYLQYTALPAKVFMTVGEHEDEEQIAGWKLLTDSIDSRNTQGLEMTSIQIEGEVPVSQALIALIKGMQAVFK